MEVGDALVNHMGAAYVNNERMSALNEMINVSLCCPHFVPVSALSMLSRDVLRVMSDCM